MKSSRSALVATGGEDLLELVDGENEPRCVRHARGRLQRAHRLLARPDDDLTPAFAAGQHTVRQRRQQPGLDDRGLSTARRSDDAEHRGADQPRDELRDELLPSEEVRGVGDLK